MSPIYLFCNLADPEKSQVQDRITGRIARRRMVKLNVRVSQVELSIITFEHLYVVQRTYCFRWCPRRPTCLRGGSIGEGQRAASCEKSAPSPFSHPTAPSKAYDSGVVLKLDVNVFVINVVITFR